MGASLPFARRQLGGGARWSKRMRISPIVHLCIGNGFGRTCLLLFNKLLVSEFLQELDHLGLPGQRRISASLLVGWRAAVRPSLVQDKDSKGTGSEGEADVVDGTSNSSGRAICT